MLKKAFAILAVVACLTAVAGDASAATDVPKGDWSYSAVQDLANKGLLKGYPKNVDIFDGRTVNRYEMAALVSRVVARLTDDQQAVQSASPETRDEVSKLLQDYNVELTVMGTDISDLKLGLQAVTDTLADQQKQINNLQRQEDSSYGSNKSRKFSITGLIEARAVQAAGPGNSAYFPNGSNGASTSNSHNGLSGIGSAYNGAYALGSSAGALEVKRARIIMMGNPAPTTYYKMQLDVAGSINNSTTPVKVLEAYGRYTPGDGSSKYPYIQMGGFANFFGYILPLSPIGFWTPERPLAFSENNNYGMWDSQDYDKGVKIGYAPADSPWSLAYGVVNGTGRNSENVSDHFDSIYRVAYSTPDKVLNLGASYYDGRIYYSDTSADLTPIGKKQLWGVDGQVFAKNGLFLMGEFERGTYEKLSFFSGATPSSLAFTQYANAGNVDNTAYLKGNQAQGYYVWYGYTLNKNSQRPLSIGGDYDVFQRALSNSVANYHGSDYDDVNYGFGAMYYLDKATRLRLWYDQPTSIAHAYSSPEPPKYGLYTAEMLFIF